jgi:hypothetical protein
MFRGALIWTALAAALVAAPVRGQALLEVRSWKPSFGAEALATAGGVGTEIDFAADLGLADERFTGFRLTWESGPRSFITVGYETVSYEGERSITRTLDFDGTRFDAGLDLKSELDIRSALIRWGWQFMGTRDRRVAFGPMLELAAFSLEGTLDAPEHDPRLRVSRRFEGYVPAVGVAINISPTRSFHVFAHAATLPVTRQGRYDSAEVGVMFRSVGGLFVSTGYRTLRLQMEKSEPDFVTLEQKGPYLGLAFRF